MPELKSWFALVGLLLGACGYVHSSGTVEVQLMTLYFSVAHHSFVNDSSSVLCVASFSKSFESGVQL